MRINKLIIITIMLFALLICVDVANAVTFTDNFDNTNAWVKTGGVYTDSNRLVLDNNGDNVVYINTFTGDIHAHCEIMFDTNNVENSVDMIFSGYCGQGKLDPYAPAIMSTYYYDNVFHLITDDSWTLSTNTWYAGDLYYYASNNTGEWITCGKSLKHTLPNANNSNVSFSIYKTTDIGKVYIRSFSIEATSLAQSNTTFNGYVKDANGNALQYCNVTLWDGNAYGTALKYDLTDANGYYEFDPQTVNINGLYNISVKPPNAGYTNLYGFTANATTPITLNFTSVPVRLQVYVYDANFGITHGLSGVNITVDKNTGASITHWYNKTSPWNDPNEFYVGDYVNVTAEKTGYVTQSYIVTQMAGGWNVVNIGLSQDFGGGSFVYMLGYVRTGGDGYKVPGVKMWLLDEANNVIDTSTSGIGNSAGYYALRVPTTPDLTYHAVVYAPGYGNKTAHLHNGGATTSFGTGSAFTYPAAFAGTIDGNAQVDLILDDLTWLPSAYPTPTPSTSAPVVPTGYNTIFGSTYVITTGQNIAGIPVWVYGQDGSTLIGSGTSDASGNFVITFSTSGLASQILKIVPGETSKYNNDSATTYISWPFAGASSSYRLDVGLEPNADYAQWIMQGWFYNALKGEQYHISGGTLNLWTGDGNTLVSTVGTNGNGYYIMYLEQTITPGTYIVEAKATGYTHQNATMSIPESFGSDEYYNLSVAMVPASIGTDNNNALGIQITDNSTGNILNNAHYVIRYAANGTTYTTGSMGGQYVVYLYNLPPATYEIEGSFVGYDTTSYVIEIAANNWYKIIIGLTPVLAPTPYPTGTIGPGTPTPVTNPNGGLQWDGILAYMLNSFGIYDPVLVRLLKGVLIMFGLALMGGFAGAILERGKGTAVTLIFAVLGASLGFIIACLVPGIWPWWLLVVVLIVAIFGFVLWKYISGGLNTGGNGGA